MREKSFKKDTEMNAMKNPARWRSRGGMYNGMIGLELRYEELATRLSRTFLGRVMIARSRPCRGDAFVPARSAVRGGGD